jgi:DNA-binding NtrC family response regulator
MMSGHGTIDTAVEAIKFGAMAFLEKPITLQKLLRAVEQGLAKPKPQLAADVVANAAGLARQDRESTLLQPVLMVAGAGVAVPLGPQPEQSFELDRPLREARDAFEKAYFEFHLARENGSMTRVAEKTGLERTHLYRKLKQLGVDLTRGKKGIAA